MTDIRPQVESMVVAELIEGVPGRVRKRLDKEPGAASKWIWSASPGQWTVNAGEETVTIKSNDGKIQTVGNLQCTCLLSPHCFHILACVSALSIIHPASGTLNSDPLESASQDSESTVAEPDAPEATASQIAITEAMRAAAVAARTAINSIVTVGASRSGLLLQSSCLRAGHHCRSSGLVALGNALLRIVEGIQRLRMLQDTADAEILREDLTTAMTSAYTIATKSECPRWMIGQARRAFEPVDVRSLAGLCAEPILTLSGFAGVCVYLLSTTRGCERIFTVNELRTGDAQLVNQAYRGGIAVGNLTIEASKLCRSSVAVQNLTASSEGRLGKGQSTRWALSTTTNNQSRLTEGRFGLPIAAQIEHVFRSAALPIEERPGGWDLVAFDCEIVGARQASLVVCIDPTFDSLTPTLWECRVAIDDPNLAYRENLELLARCSRLKMRCLGRVRLESASEIDLIAISQPIPTQEVSAEEATSPDEDSPPQLDLPEAWQGLCNLGLDRLQRHFVYGVKRWSDELVMTKTVRNIRIPDGLSPLQRRITALVLGGRTAVPTLDSSTHRRDRANLQANYQITAAELLEMLAVATMQNRESDRAHRAQQAVDVPSIDETFLACANYLQSARIHFEHSRWRIGIAE